MDRPHGVTDDSEQARICESTELLSENSQIHAVGTSLSILNDGSIRGALLDKKLQPSSGDGFPWEKLPYELREKIFALVHQQGCSTQLKGRHPVYCKSYYERHSNMPALVVALRLLPKSYHHVLEWFCKFNHSFNTGANGLLSLSDMTQSELAAFKYLKIALNSDVHQVAKWRKSSSRYEFSTPTWFTAPFLHATNLRMLTLCVDPGPRAKARSDAMGFITEFPFWLQGCQALNRVSVETPTNFELMTRSARNKSLEKMVKRIDEKLGVKGYVAYEVGYNLEDDEVAEMWVWKVAKGGKPMDWTQDLGRAWSRRSGKEKPLCRSHWDFYDGAAELGLKDGQFVIENWNNWQGRTLTRFFRDRSE
ncbi:hypothetical protein LAWI1_G005151 [Lachnellula willkommii]|uniref:Uncharacterized protein n=1 Tax=Lachnellula willkommii TaxID=215461 RepID=A0A559MEC0_9HELO|nr:hypothetical protein LAWI1_G005151 [Lachnellula willkommii]